MHEFWNEAVIPVYFVYGLAFYSMGLALLIESGRSSELHLARAIRLMAGFGVLHGIHEWLDMVERGLVVYYDTDFPLAISWLRLSLMVTSFILLLAFGQLLLRFTQQTRPGQIMAMTLIAYTLMAALPRFFYELDEQEWLASSAAVARYGIGIPGSLLACIALLRQRTTFRERDMDEFSHDLTMAAVALALYGVVGQVFVGKAVIFPAHTIHSDLFLDIVGVPIQLFRATLAVVVAVGMIRVLRALEIDNRRQLTAIEMQKRKAEDERREALARLNEELRRNQAERDLLFEEVQKRDAMRGVLLHRITAAQEAERQRIARELHDETGQALTGLSLGVRGVANKLAKLGMDREATYLKTIEKTATEALSDLRLLINDLRPPQLDDMGLGAALRFLVERCNRVSETEFALNVHGDAIELPPEVETTIFRVAQEGLNNIIKHAHAKSADITLQCTDGRLTLRIEDDGRGFDPNVALEPNTTRTAWGLLGMQERANLIDASLELNSQPGKGTTLILELEQRKVAHV